MEQQNWLTIQEASLYTGKNISVLQSLIDTRQLSAMKVKLQQDITWMISLQECQRLVAPIHPDAPGVSTVRENERGEVLDMGIWKTTGKSTVKLDKTETAVLKKSLPTIRFPKGRDTVRMSADTKILDKNPTTLLERADSNSGDSKSVDELARIIDEAFDTSFTDLHDQILTPLMQLQQQAEDISLRISSKNRELREQFDSIIQENRSLIEQIIYLPTPIESKTAVVSRDTTLLEEPSAGTSREEIDRIVLRAKIEKLHQAREKDLEDQRKAVEQSLETQKRTAKYVKERDEFWSRMQQDETSWRATLTLPPERRAWWRRILGF